jgi:hypothetical protein
MHLRYPAGWAGADAQGTVGQKAKGLSGITILLVTGITRPRYAYSWWAGGVGAMC